MQQKAAILQNKGMSRDFSVSKASNEYAFENHNIRITARDHDTLLSVTNERGNKKIENLSFNGTLIGWNVLNNYLILFTKDSVFDYIYRVEYTGGGFKQMTIFQGDLGLDATHPIESLMDYETEDIQKIYWIDGKNVLRYLNFSDTYLKKHLKSGEIYGEGDKAPKFTFEDDNTWFDSTRAAKNMPVVTITKDNGGNNRANGVAQYFLTYYNKNGQQTGIVWSSPLVYLSPSNVGGAADGMNSSRVTLTLSNLDETFEYIRIYQIVRTSYNGTTVAYIVAESSISDGKAIVVDNGAPLSTTDASSFLFLGSQSIVAGTMTQKDGTLFLGDLQSIGQKGVSELEDVIKANAFILHGDKFKYGTDWESQLVTFDYSSSNVIADKKNNIPYVAADGYYPYDSQLNYTNEQVTTFKGGEKYRFALQFFKGDGTSSKPFWIGDKVNPYYPQMRSNNSIKRAIALCQLPPVIVSAAQEAGFVSVQLMIAEATYSDRSVQAQGIVSPTVFNLYDRYSDNPFVQASWIYRTRGGVYPYRHFDTLNKSNEAHAELQASYWKDTPLSEDDDIGLTRPSPLYYTTKVVGDTGGELATKPLGFFQYTHIMVVANINAQKILTKYWGDITISYYTSASLDSLAATYTFSLGGGSALYHNSELKFTSDWMRFYDDADVPSYLRLSDDEIMKWCKTALEHASWVKPGSAKYTSYSGSTPVPTKIKFSNVDHGRRFASLSREYFFVDENVVTLNSPEIEAGEVNVDRNTGLKFRIVGAARMTSNLSDYSILADDALYPGERVLKYNFSTTNISSNTGGVSSWPLYLEYGWGDPDGDGKEQRLEHPFAYMMYMWHKNGSIPLYEVDEKMPSILKTKRFANLHYAHYSIYNNIGSTNGHWQKTPADIRQFDAVTAQLYNLKVGSETKVYMANVNEIVSMPQDTEYPIYHTEQASLLGEALALDTIKSSSDLVPITYNSRPHAVISLPKSWSETILPYMTNADKFQITESTEANVNDGPFAAWDSNVYNKYTLLYWSAARSSGAPRTYPVQIVETDTNKQRLTAKTSNVTAIEYWGDVRSSVRQLTTATTYVPIQRSDSEGNLYIYLADIQSYSAVTLTAGLRQYGDWKCELLFSCYQYEMSTVSYTIYGLPVNSRDGQYVVLESATDLKLGGNEKNYYPYFIDLKTTQYDYLKVEYKVTFESPVYNNQKLIPDVIRAGDDALIWEDRVGISYHIIKVAGIFDNAKFIDSTDESAIDTFYNLCSKTVGTLDYENERFTTTGTDVKEYSLPTQEPFFLDSKTLIPDGSEYLFIGELYHDYDSDAADFRYGGISENAVESNRFIAASQRQMLTDGEVVGTPMTATISMEKVLQYLSGLTENDKTFNLNIWSDRIKTGPAETLSLDSLSNMTAYAMLPTSKDMVSTLRVAYDAEKKYWYSQVTELSKAQTDIIANSSEYCVCVLRYGYARRGLWRYYVNKYGTLQSSHTTRASGEYGYKSKRRGYANGLPAKRMRIIGMDLLISSKPMSAQQSSSTWKVRDGRTDYTKATLVSDLGDALVLPEIRVDRPDLLTRNRVFSDKSRNGIIDLYIGLYHREKYNGRNEWKLVSNVVKVRGRDNYNKKVWEFATNNIILQVNDDGAAERVE